MVNSKRVLMSRKTEGLKIEDSYIVIGVPEGTHIQIRKEEHQHLGP